MLRRALLLVALAILAIGLGGLLLGAPSGPPMAIWGAVLLAAVLVERWRYRPSSPARPDTWQPTGERFIDPESGRPMQVLYNPSTGERRYEWVQPQDQPVP
ncbi:MAG TPA: hypothetical protein VEI29_06600 [Burkholderiaceae bacterium]|nr:hypothetical protein [Burkholderiaceae bacterium]